MRFSQSLSFRQFFYFQAMRLSELDLIIHIKNCFTSRITNMHMYRLMIITIEEELKAILLKNNRHRSNLPQTCRKYKSIFNGLGRESLILTRRNVFRGFIHPPKNAAEIAALFDERLKRICLLKSGIFNSTKDPINRVRDQWGVTR